MTKEETLSLLMAMQHRAVSVQNESWSNAVKVRNEEMQLPLVVQTAVASLMADVLLAGIDRMKKMISEKHAEEEARAAHIKRHLSQQTGGVESL